MTQMKFNAVYYETAILSYPLGQELKKQYEDLEWIEIESHNRIPEMQKKPNSEFGHMKQNLIIGTRKTHKYVENHKVSDYLVPYTSSGCSAMCLYCYLVCNYNKCSYLRLFVNREQMMDKIIKESFKGDSEHTFEIGSNSDLILENVITKNLEWTIPYFAEKGKGFLTFPTKFHMVDPLLTLPHQGKTLFRMCVNPEEIIQQIELGTSSLDQRIEAVNKMAEAGYPIGILVAPVILVDHWQELYTRLFITLKEKLSVQVKKQMFIEIILMTYSFVHRAINADAFPKSPDLYNSDKMTGRGRGKYSYKQEERESAERFLRKEILKVLGDVKILYIS